MHERKTAETPANPERVDGRVPEDDGDRGASTMSATKKDGKRSPHGLVNSAISGLLASRLHFLLSGGTLLLTITGRKSGGRYDVPLNWVPSGDGGLVCFTGKGWSGWWKNVDPTGTPVSVTFRGERLPATARLVGDPGSVERGLRAFLARFPSNAKPFGVSLGAGKLPEEGGLTRAARDDGTVMVGITFDQPAPGR